MPELIRIQTKSWELSIWGGDIQEAQSRYFRTLDKRGVVGPRLPYSVSLSSGVTVEDVGCCVGHSVESCRNILCSSPIFFENAQYQFELLFLDGSVGSAKVIHKLQAVNESFHFSPARAASFARLSGALNTGNNVGWLTLPVSFFRGDVAELFTVSFEVLPTKMDLYSDLPIISRQIDEVYPLWRFSIAEKTSQNASKGQVVGNFPIMWLAQFKALTSQFFAALNVVSSSPHSRLQGMVSYKKAERLRGRVSEKVCEQVREDLLLGVAGRYYKQERKFLSVNTLENQFVKHVVLTCRKYISVIHGKLTLAANEAPYKRLSVHFLDELDSWQSYFSSFMRQSMWSEVDSFKAHGQDSLALQQKPGYSGVYRVWQQLKYYLDFFSGESSISIKPISELYEVWCFLTLRSILVERLGFVEKTAKVDRLRVNSLFEYELSDGVRGAFEFERSDGVSARLAHEPVFRSNGVDIQSFTVAQKPDIFLDISFPNGKRCVWVFDAKYRIKANRSQFDTIDVDAMDYVPDDAINQMHRYRDALISMSNLEVGGRSRPVFGAFALYPGYYDQMVDCNPYAYSIDQVGVGAFPLLPSVEGDKFSKWLVDFLVSKIGQLALTTGSGADSGYLSDVFYLQGLLRIPAAGMRQFLYSDLVLIAPWSLPNSSSPEGFLVDGAKSYILPSKFLNGRFDIFAFHEVCFIALVAGDVSNSYDGEIQLLWPVRKAFIPKNIDCSDEECVFDLGEPLRLKNAIKIRKGLRSLDIFRLTTLSGLDGVKHFEDIPCVYNTGL